MRKPYLLPALLLLGTILPAAWAQRLPHEATPTHYSLHFTPDLKAATFAGDEVIDLNIEKPTSAITLNAADITFDSVTIKQNGKDQAGTVQLQPEKLFAVLTFPQQLSAGAAQVHIQFKGILNDKLRGFYLSKGKDRTYATTQFESTDARRAFPSFDEPAYKATFDIALTIDQADTAISNGSIAKDSPGPKGKHTLTFTTSPKMSTYLVAMAVGDWKCIEGDQDGIPVRVCATPDKVNLAPYALTGAKQILGFYDKYYGIKYPFKKLDVLAVPDFEAGAMENTAAIFYRETELLIDDQHASVGSHKLVFDVLAHEMAHQWFGDLVTMQWWNDIWLNEGFASWMTYKPDEAIHPDWKGSLAEADETAGVLGIDSRKTTRAIRQQATTPEEINELFDGIAYGKAASVLRMVEHFITPEVFRKGVNAYLNEHQYGNATAEDFWGTMTRVSGKPVDKIMRSFTEQPGAPILTVDAECTNSNSVKIAQQRFFDDKASVGSAPSQVWTVPVCVHPKSGQDSCSVAAAKDESTKTQSCQSGSFFNADGRGFYRTQYTPAELKAISVPALKPEEKILLLSDQWALTRAGQQPIGNFLELAGSLANDPERFVLEHAIGPMATIHNHLVNDSDRKQFESWIDKTLTPLMDRVGFEPKPGETSETTELRPEVMQVLGEIGHDQRVLTEARTLAEKYLQDPDSVDATMAGTVLRLAATGNDPKLYDAYVAAMPKSKTPEQFYRLGRSFNSFDSPELVKRTILYGLSSQVRNQDAAFIFAGELQNPRSRDTAWQVIKENWPAVQKTFTMSSGGAVVASAGGFCDPQSRADVAQFFTEHKVASAERGLKQSLEQIDSCIDFRNNQSQKLEQWLTKQN